MPQFDLGIVASKATQTAEALGPVAHLFKKGAILSSQNGLGSEEVIAALSDTFVIRGTTFMSGTRHTDTHVQYELDTATWMGPFEPTKTPFALVKEAAELITSSGLKAVALEDARPAVVEADLQFLGQFCCRAHRIAAQFSFCRGKRFW